MKKLIVLSWFLLQVMVGYSQNITDVEFRSVATSNPDIRTSSFVVILSDSNQIDKIEVELGSVEDQNDLIDQNFDFDVTTGLPSGFSYLRVGNRVFLGTSTITTSPTYSGRLRLKYSSGLYSSYFSFTAN